MTRRGPSAANDASAGCEVVRGIDAWCRPDDNVDTEEADDEEAGDDVDRWWCPVPVLPFDVDDVMTTGDVAYDRGPPLAPVAAAGAGRDMPGENRNGMPDDPPLPLTPPLAKGNDAGDAGPAVAAVAAVACA